MGSGVWGLGFRGFITDCPLAGLQNNLWFLLPLTTSIVMALHDFWCKVGLYRLCTCLFLFKGEDPTVALSLLEGLGFKLFLERC